MKVEPCLVHQGDITNHLPSGVIKGFFKNYASDVFVPKHATTVIYRRKSYEFIRGQCCKILDGRKLLIFVIKLDFFASGKPFLSSLLFVGKARSLS